MQSLPRLLAALALGLSVFCTPFVASAQDQVSRDGFEALDVVTTDAETARFLNQATFGATRTAINALKNDPAGLEAWIDREFNKPMTLSRPFMEQLAVIENTAGRDLTQDNRVQRWYDVAVTANDQLRQKVAYALSQLIVISDQDAGLSDEPVMMAEWNDLLVRNAFGSYNTFMGEATFSPMMGRYLTALRNRKFEVRSHCENANTAGVDEVRCDNANAGANPSIKRYEPLNNANQPDENYAREIMQLFSIGLVSRAGDGSVIPDPGVPANDLPTYNQQTITTLSRVFTGLGYQCTGTASNVAGQTITRTCGCTGTACNFNNGNFGATPPRATINQRDDLVHPDRYNAMICYPRYHDTGRDEFGYQLPLVGDAPNAPALQNPVGATLDPGMTLASLPGGMPERDKDVALEGELKFTLSEINPGQPRSAAVNCQAGTLTEGQRQQCIDQCNADIGTAVANLFLQSETAFTVSRHLIQRLVTSNPSPAYIQRVTDRFNNNGANVRGDMKAVIKAVLLDPEARRAPSDPAQPANFGKPREPLLKLVQIWRNLGYVSGDTRADGYRRWGPNSPQNVFFQRPLGAPSVFNFYQPEYSQPGQIMDAGLVSPEFQIINENTSMLTANELLARICSGYGGNNRCEGTFGTAPTDRAYLPTAALDSLPSMNCGALCSGVQDAALIDELDIRLMGGTMSGQIGNPNLASSPDNNGMKGELFRLMRTGLTGNLGSPNDLAGRRREALYVLHMIAISPEFAMQR